MFTGFYKLHKKDVALCEAASERLKAFQSAGQDVIYLNVTQDLPEQIIALNQQKLCL